jgi:hypothetical protein
VLTCWNRRDEERLCDVLYGNIGTPERIEFPVIASARVAPPGAAQ